jgi:hypothetical protein
LPGELDSIGIGRQPADARVRTSAVVVPSPFLEQGACLGERGERRLVEELVAQPAIEALDEGVLHWFAEVV